jgi:surface antigen
MVATAVVAVLLAAGTSALAAAPAPLRITIHDHTVTFPYGQCTYWAATKRPDIVRTALEKGIFGDWDARAWSRIASRAGYVLSHRPTPGAIAVWQPGVDGAGPPGHVAYVESVHPGGSYTVSEMNFNGSSTVHRRTVRLDRNTVFIGRRRLGA